MTPFDYTDEIIDRYRVNRQLGAGGMGTVYLGEHVITERRVAIKFLHAKFTGDEGVVKRFVLESQASARIGHPSIIDVLDAGVSENGEPFIVMEYLEGESLSSMLRRTGPIELAGACGILEPVLLGLQAAHDKGVIHRDLKPDNIFLAGGEDGVPIVKIIDFGISKFMSQSDHSQMTTVGTRLGTPAYMPPEQVKNAKTVSFGADLFAMGVILYELLTGKRPFHGESHEDLIHSILHDAPTPPGEAFAGFPSEAEPVIMRALQKQAEHRYQTASAMLSDLKKLDAFARRRDRLSHYTSSILEKGVASGDLGDETCDTADSRVVSEILAHMLKKRALRHEPHPAERRQRRRRILVGGLTVVVLLVAAITYLRAMQAAVPVVSAFDRPTPAAPPRTDSPEQEVRIELRGVPPRATVLFNDAQMMNNPFWVTPGKKSVLLRVELEGRVPFKRWVKPNTSQIIEVSMSEKMPETPAQPTSAPESAPEKREQRPPKKRPAHARSLTDEESPRGKALRPGSDTDKEKMPDLSLKESAKGVKFSEKFE